MPADTDFMDKLVALCKRRGFIYPSSEIYGGINGFWDYGPLGVELKRNIKNQWWQDMVTNPPAGLEGKEIEMVGLDCSIIMNPKVWEASGHATGFADLMVDCKQCKRRFRADKVFFAGLFEGAPPRNNAMVVAGTVCIQMPRSVLATEADDLRTALSSLEETHARLVKKRKVEGNLALDVCSVAAIPESWGAGWKRTCPADGCDGELTEPRQFNLMLETYPGAIKDEANKAYLRPETAQGIFANYKNVVDTTRVKIPFGIAQVGKSFRNEINPRNFIFRTREFEQMEMEFFCQDETALDWYQFWRKTRFDWYTGLGLKSEKLRLRDQGPEELAHYSKACADIEYLFPFSEDFQELEGVAHRGCYDLTQHQKHSGKDLSYFDDELWQKDAARYAGDKDAATKAKAGPPYRFLPTVIEPAAGADRAALAFLCEAYTEDQKADAKGVMQTRVFMRFHPKLAPIKAAFLPLVNRDGMPDVAYQIYRSAKQHWNVQYDDGGAIGRRYYRQDEAGTPFCITVDGETLKDGTVTIRDRDSLEQLRVGKDEVLSWLQERLGS